MTKADFKTGQQVFIVDSFLYNRNMELQEGEIVRVGNKYGYARILGKHREIKFNYTTMREVADSNYLAKIWVCKDEFEKEVELATKKEAIISFFKFNSLSKLSETQIDTIYKIINPTL